MVARPFRSRIPKSSPLWKCFDAHFERFIAAYPRDYRSRYGVLRGVIPEVVDKFMGRGDFTKGFARVRCDECSHEYLLAFSCKGRWFCPSCHQKKVQVFGAMLAESIVAAVPHRHFTFTISPHDFPAAAAVLSISPRIVEAALSHRGERVSRYGATRAIHCSQSIFDCEDAGESLGRFDSLSLGNEREDQA